ncbi:esterase FE4-like [Planococcus citri]|uniref:esterase FE4-like n=1 Tax=Planococcus citri TaxID=170843 RepID=UPI0031F84061
MIVNVKQGSLSGKRSFTILAKKPYLCYLGIPYALPPVGELRFQAPKPLHQWTGVFDATKEPSPCLQKPPALNIIGSEDCLYLNVYAPETFAPANSLKPVMVYIHGGGFAHGSGNSSVYGPDFLLEYDVIVVTINYRLLALGFLNLGIPECPGNVGIKDQLMALQWIKDNIIHFGGDPNNITVFGESAGASSVHYLAISPATQPGLFHKAILQSGFCLASWSLASNTIETAFELGRRLGYFGNDRFELLKHLRQQPAKQLVRVANQLKEERSQLAVHEQSRLVFAPSVEFIREGAMIPDHPTILQQIAPPMPMIWGCTDLEGLLGVGVMTKKNLELVMKDASVLLRKYFNIDPIQLNDKTAQVMTQYFHDAHAPRAKIRSLSNLITDIYFYNMEDSLDHLSGTCFPPFVYEFSYNGKMNVMKKFFCMKLGIHLPGACHGDDISYLFHRKTAFPKKNFDQGDLKVIGNMCTLWTNFAKYGNPVNATWRPYTRGNPCYLKIDENIQLVNGPLRGYRPQALKNILGPYSMKMLTN